MHKKYNGKVGGSTSRLEFHESWRDDEQGDELRRVHKGEDDKEEVIIFMCNDTREMYMICVHMDD